MTSKVEDSNTASKIYCSILNLFLYDKNIPALPPSLVDGNFILDFCEKANLINNFFASIWTTIKIIADYLLLSIKQTPEFIALVLRIRLYYQ